MEGLFRCYQKFSIVVLTANFPCFFPNHREIKTRFTTPDVPCFYDMIYDDICMVYIFRHIRVIFGVNVNIPDMEHRGNSHSDFVGRPLKLSNGQAGESFGIRPAAVLPPKYDDRVILSSYHWIILDMLYMLDGKSQHHIKTTWCHDATWKKHFFPADFSPSQRCGHLWPWSAADWRLGVDVDLQEGQDLVAVDLEGEPIIMGLQSVYKTLGRMGWGWLVEGLAWFSNVSWWVILVGVLSKWVIHHHRQ